MTVLSQTCAAQLPTSDHGLNICLLGLKPQARQSLQHVKEPNINVLLLLQKQGGLDNVLQVLPLSDSLGTSPR